MYKQNIKGTKVSMYIGCRWNLVSFVFHMISLGIELPLYSIIKKVIKNLVVVIVKQWRR